MKARLYASPIKNIDPGTLGVELHEGYRKTSPRAHQRSVIDLSPDQHGLFSGAQKNKWIAAGTVLLSYIALQQYLWSGSYHNKVCLKDNFLYGTFGQWYHDWAKANWNVRTVIVVWNTLWINIPGYISIAVGFIGYGIFTEGLLTYFTFTWTRALTQAIIIYQHPIDSLVPDQTPLPGSTKIMKNDYYFSGHTASATTMLCLYYWWGYSKPMTYACAFMVVFTGLNMSLHRGHFIHDIYIGFMITILFFIFFVITYDWYRYWATRLYLCCLYGLVGEVAGLDGEENKAAWWKAVVKLALGAGGVLLVGVWFLVNK